MQRGAVMYLTFKMKSSFAVVQLYTSQLMMILNRKTMTKRVKKTLHIQVRWPGCKNARMATKFTSQLGFMVMRKVKEVVTILIRDGDKQKTEEIVNKTIND